MLGYGKVLLKMLDTMTVINPHLEGKTRTGTLPLTTEVHQHLNSPYPKKTGYTGQETNFDIQLPSGPVHFSFQLPRLKHFLRNRSAMFTPYKLHVL